MRKAGPFTLGAAMHDYVEWKRVAAAETHFLTNLSLINHHIIPRLGDLPLEEFTGRVFTAFCLDVLETAPKLGNRRQGPRRRLADLDPDSLRKRKKTLNALIGILRLAIRMAWENGETDSDRAWRCLRRVPHADVPRQVFLNREECRRLLQACRPDLALLVRGALYTGCRVTELGRLTVADVGRDMAGIYVAPLKSYRGRHVLLPDEGRDFFRGLCDGRPAADLVFRTRTGRSWRDGHKAIFRDAVQAAGLLPGFVFHGLRHTYASQLVAAGMPLAMVARQLGHANTDTVSRTYGHLACDSVQAELRRCFQPIESAGSSGQTMQVPRAETGWPMHNHSRLAGALAAALSERAAPGHEL